MSYDLGVFVRGSSVDAIVSMLHARFHTTTALEDTRSGSISAANVFGIRLAIIADHGLVDDVGTPFTHYPFQVNFTLQAARIEPTAGRFLCHGMARLVAAALRDSGAESLIVEELQNVVDETMSTVVQR